MAEPAEEWLDTKGVSLLLGCSEHSLRRRRMAGYAGEPGPPWVIHLGGRVRYRRSDVLVYMNSRRMTRAPSRIPAPPPR